MSVSLWACVCACVPLLQALHLGAQVAGGHHVDLPPDAVPRHHGVEAVGQHAATHREGLPFIL